MPGRPIYYITRIVPAYRRPILERLNDRLSGRLIVCHGEPPRGSSLTTLSDPAPSSYRNLYLKTGWLRTPSVHMQDVTKPFRVYGRPSVVLAEESPRSLTLVPLVLGAKACGIPIVLWGHFSSNSRSLTSRNLPQRYRLWMARKADACVAYTSEIRDMLSQHVEDERCFTATNTLDVDTLLSLHTSLSDEGKGAVRRRLGLPVDKRIIAFIGRLDQEKGVHRLPKILGHFDEKRRPHLVVIGDGYERHELERTTAETGIPVHFAGALPPEASAPYLFACDLVVLPGPVGLAVNHAFAMGLPVVTDRSPGSQRFHSPEISFVRDGHNAVLAEHGNNAEMAAVIESVLQDRERLARNALEFARENLRPDRMIDGLVAALDFAERTPRRFGQ